MRPRKGHLWSSIDSRRGGVERDSISFLELASRAQTEEACFGVGRIEPSLGTWKGPDAWKVRGGNRLRYVSDYPADRLEVRNIQGGSVVQQSSKRISSGRPASQSKPIIVFNVINLISRTSRRVMP